MKEKADAISEVPQAMSEVPDPISSKFTATKPAKKSWSS